jgi:P4 family phage/plasmid primase-like protien
MAATKAAKKSKYATYDIDEVRRYANGRWAQILSQLCGIDADLLDGRHHPCPKCGGTDRFRFSDQDGDGSCLCNQCGKSGNGFDALAWFTGDKFAVVLARVADHLGVQPSRNGHAGSRPESADPAAHLEWLAWNDLLVGAWCLRKPPIIPQAVAAAGGRLARYRKNYTVIALPVWGEKLDAAEPVGWCLYNITGGTLPKFSKRKLPGGKEEVVTEQVKVKLTFGSKPGVIGNLMKIRAAAELWKVEGPSDMLGFESLPDLPADVAAITNANGCGEQPAAWMLELFADKRARIAHDADEPGQRGALAHTNERGQERPGWANRIAEQATECRNVVLPYEVAETHGKDIRDYFNEGHIYGDLAKLADAAESIGQEEVFTAKPIEADDDPHRLARINLERYATHSRGATIRFWRDEWFTWKPSRGCYRRISESELRAKLTQAIKEEFDRLNLIDQQESESDKPPKARKVTRTLVSNVLAALAGMVCIPSSVEQMTWIATTGGGRRRRNMIAMANGLIDLDALLSGKPNAECILPHSPEWFSTIRLPYAFDLSAQCPKWESFLERNLEGDSERESLLQEWAGYLLLPDTGQQKFLVLEGEGSNGKSVYCSAIAGMLGLENCSHVPLEQFGDRFSKTQTLGKLVNVCADVGELDKIAEGFLKSFTSGDVMFFDRKGISGVECVPTARLMFACNNRPRFTDRSSGIWRRMLIVPWQVEIKHGERVANMDKAWWWEHAGELPGIFNWALRGLVRLRQQGRFTESLLSQEAVEEYREESNPARAFLKDHVETSTGSAITSGKLYTIYKKWTDENGYRPLSEKVFGKEVRRVFSHIERKKGGGRTSRYWYYQGIAFSVDEICGEKTSETGLF